MAKVSALGYLRIGAPDLVEWRAFATGVLGMQVGERAARAGEGDALYLRADERSYRIAVEEGKPGLRQMGFEVANLGNLEALAQKLDSAGVEVEQQTAAYARSRSVTAIMICQDPMGNTIELFHGAHSDKEQFVSPTGAQFVTDGLGYGHLFFLVPESVAFHDFYVGLLGFRVSDQIATGSSMATFLHCNPRHHTIAFVETPGNHGLAHTMLEVDALDTVGRSYDLCLDGAAPISATLGKHTNDKMVSFYVDAPSGLTVEYGTAGLKIDDGVWTTQLYDAQSYWGHHRDAPH